MDVYDVIVEYLRERKRGAIATIINKLGAAPREEGARMFVGEDAKVFGTIGGGRMEAEVQRHAENAMKSGEAEFMHYRMDGTEVELSDMICGGDIDVFIEPLYARHAVIFKAIQTLQKRGKRAVLITGFKKGTFSKSLLDAYGGRWGDPIREEDLEKYNAYFTGKKPLVLDGETIVEPLRIISNLLIFGAGHVSRYLAKSAKMVDFNVTVIDDRADFSNKERFPEADKIVTADFAEVFNELDYTGDVYAVIVTRGHRYDAYVLEEALKRPAKYIGMIGSKRKVELVYDYLEKKGFRREILSRVHAPIGIKINSETPQEIAISIVAELISVRGE